jgi:hypothetical protein
VLPLLIERVAVSASESFEVVRSLAFLVVNNSAGEFRSVDSDYPARIPLADFSNEREPSRRTARRQEKSGRSLATGARALRLADRSAKT